MLQPSCFGQSCCSGPNPEIASTAGMGRVLASSKGIVQIYQNYVAIQRAEFANQQAEFANQQAEIANQQAEIANQQAEIANQHAEMKNVILFWFSLIIAVCVIAATMKVT